MTNKTHVCTKSEEIAKLRTSLIIVNTSLNELKRDMATIKMWVYRAVIGIIGLLAGSLVSIILMLLKQ